MKPEPNVLQDLITLCKQRGLDEQGSRDSLLFAAIAMTRDPNEFLDTCHTMVDYVIHKLNQEQNK